MLLTLSHITKSYGHLPVLDDISLTVTEGQKIGLVGANGAGKSTLLKVIVGDTEMDSGTVTLHGTVSVGYLPQVIETMAGQTVDDLINTALSEIRGLEQQLRSIEMQLQTATPDESEKLMATYGDVTEQYERRGGYALDYRLDTVLSGMGVNHLSRDQEAGTLSGGEKARLGLALLLLAQPDLLLLDEPTNHLDFATMEWLETYLQGYTGGMMVVSHDRRFLNQTVSVIIEIDEFSRKAKRYTGNYDAYLAAKAIEREKWQEEYERQEEELAELRRLLKEKKHKATNSKIPPPPDGDKFFKHRLRERADKTLSRNLGNIEERIARIEENRIPEPPDPLTINPDFDPKALANKTPLAVSGVSKAWVERGLVHPVSFTVGARDRIAIVGENGTGKSTLLKVLAGLELPDTGEVHVASMVKVGYLDQEQETMNPNQTLFEAYREGFTADPEVLKAQLFNYGLFVYEDLLKRVGDLSIGQRRKLQVARLIADRANLLLLDEPTNHLSFEVLEAFEQALVNFPGPVLAASHDRYFIERFATRLFEIRDGQLIEHNVLADAPLPFSQSRVA